MILRRGKFYEVGPGTSVQPCNITLQAVVTSLNGGQATAYAIPFSDLAVTQPCGTGITTVAAGLRSAR